VAQVGVGIGLQHLLQATLDHAGTGHADIDDGLRLAGPQEPPGHERIVFGNVGEHHQLGAGPSVLIGGQLGSLLDGISHQQDRVDVDARFGGRGVDRSADALGARQHLGQNVEKDPLTRGDALLHQGRKAAEKIHPNRPRRLVQLPGRLQKRLFVMAFHQPGDGADGQSLVDDGNAVLGSHLIADGDQSAGLREDLAVDLLTEVFHVERGALLKVDPQGDGPHVQLLFPQHADRREDVLASQRHRLPSLDRRNPTRNCRERPPRWWL